MKKLAVVLGLLLLTGCGGNKSELKSDMDIQAPTVLKSVNDFPKPIVAKQDILKTGTIRVISESAKNQDQYEAIESARVIASRDILVTLRGAELNSNELVTNGVLTKDEVTRLVTGNIRVFSCGNFYDATKKIAYSCMEASIK